MGEVLDAIAPYVSWLLSVYTALTLAVLFAIALLDGTMARFVRGECKHCCRVMWSADDVYLEDGKEGPTGAPKLKDEERGESKRSVLVPPEPTSRLEARLRHLARWLMVVWVIVGLAVSVYLVLNVRAFLLDDARLDKDLVPLAEEAGFNLTMRFEAPQVNDPAVEKRIVSAPYIIPPYKAAEFDAFLRRNFITEIEAEEFTLYEIDWISERCQPNCITMQELLRRNPSQGYHIRVVSAPRGTNPDILQLLLGAIILDAACFLVFAVAVGLRMKGFDSPRKRRYALLLELTLLIIGIALLLRLVVLVSLRPLVYDHVAFLQATADPKALAVPVRFGGGRAFTGTLTANFVLSVEGPEEEFTWCNARVIEGGKWLGASPENVNNGTQPCLRFAAESDRKIDEDDKLAPMEGDSDFEHDEGDSRYDQIILQQGTTWSAIIDFINEQIIQQGLLADALLLASKFFLAVSAARRAGLTTSRAVDSLVILASYHFLVI